MVVKVNGKTVEEIFKKGFRDNEKLDKMIIYNFKTMLENCPEHQWNLFCIAFEEVKKERG